MGLWCLAPLSTIIRLYRGGQLYQENTKMGILIHIGIGDVYYYFIEGP
jgi:hypothetical protein